MRSVQTTARATVVASTENATVQLAGLVWIVPFPHVWVIVTAMGSASTGLAIASLVGLAPIAVPRNALIAARTMVIVSMEHVRVTKAFTARTALSALVRTCAPDMAFAITLCVFATQASQVMIARRGVAPTIVLGMGPATTAPAHVTIRGPVLPAETFLVPTTVQIVASV